MADPNLIVDDDYVYQATRACRARANKLEEKLISYIKILEEINSEAITSGDISKALEQYIGCVNKLKDQLTSVSDDIEKVGSSFIIDINEADQYLF